MLDEPACPQCGAKQPLAALIEASDVGGMARTLRWRTGLRCPSCGALLRVTQWRWFLAHYLLVGALIWLAARVDGHPSTGYLVAVLAAFGLCWFAITKLRGRLLGFRVALPGEHVKLPLEDMSIANVATRMKHIEAKDTDR